MEKELEEMTMAEKLFTGYFKAFTEAPNFLVTHYNNELLNFLESDILSEFHEKFKLKKEELWHYYL